ncbi:MAG: hypothetical protein J6S49_04330 [Erysipelotrichaceae bacterium]|nr:hypothetical protein [Erysipelotrichaceae bacterium]MBO7697729.1 hypothetical protein [Erysipelotrichaceae bacterium]
MNLNKEISFNKKKNSLPTKTSINFIVDEQTKINRISIVTFVIFMILLALFTKFAVIDPLAKVARAEREYREAERQLDVYRNELTDYAKVESEYNEKVGTFLTDNERSYHDRTEILAMIKEDIFNYVNVKSITISGNVVRVSTATTTMENISQIVNVLLNDSKIAYVTPKTTRVGNETSNNVTADLEIGYRGKTGE